MTENFDIQIVGTKYKKRGEFGDYEFMINESIYDNSLFIFNDNTEYHSTCCAGAGNAVIRKYNKYSDLEVPRSAGIPTGSLKYDGFDELNDNVKYIIDSAVEEIKELIKKYKYKTLFYSAEKDGTLGTKIFKVDEDVLKYITNKIHNLTSQETVYLVKDE